VSIARRDCVPVDVVADVAWRCRRWVVRCRKAVALRRAVFWFTGRTRGATLAGPANAGNLGRFTATRASAVASHCDGTHSARFWWGTSAFGCEFTIYVAVSAEV